MLIIFDECFVFIRERETFIFVVDYLKYLYWLYVNDLKSWHTEMTLKCQRIKELRNQRGKNKPFIHYEIYNHC